MIFSIKHVEPVVFDSFQSISQLIRIYRQVCKNNEMAIMINNKTTKGRWFSGFVVDIDNTKLLKDM